MDKQEQILELASLKIFNLYMHLFGFVLLGIGLFFGVLWWKHDFIGWLVIAVYCEIVVLIILATTLKIHNALNRSIKRLMAEK